MEKEANAVASGSGSGSPLGPIGAATKSRLQPDASPSASRPADSPNDAYPSSYNTLSPSSLPQYGSSSNDLNNHDSGNNNSSNSNMFGLDPVFGAFSAQMAPLPSPFSGHTSHAYYSPQDKNQSYVPQPMTSLRQPDFSHDQDSPGSAISSGSPSHGLAGFNSAGPLNPMRKMKEGETPKSYFESPDVRAAVEVLPTSKQGEHLSPQPGEDSKLTFPFCLLVSVAMQLIAYHLTNYR